MSLIEIRQPEVSRDRWGRPVIGGETFIRPSSLGSAIDDKSGLVAWKAQRVAEGLSKQPDLLTRGLDLRDLADEAARAGGAEEGADFGTAVHGVVEAVLKDGMVPLGTEADVEADALAVLDRMEALGLEAIASELFVGSSDFGVAGTTDLVVRSSVTGAVLLADVKTGGGTPSYAARYSGRSWAVQLSAYAESIPLGPDGGFVQWHEIGIDPRPSRERAVVLYVPRRSGTCQAIDVDLTVGRELLVLAQQVMDVRKSSPTRVV